VRSLACHFRRFNIAADNPNSEDMRQLSINSYALLMRHSCPGIGADIVTGSDRIKAAAMWHFVHTAGIDQLERMNDEQFHEAVTAHGYSLPPQELPPIFSAMTAELRAVNDAFVETESEGLPLEVTTATSQTSNPSSSGSE
jgi:hypothetical protein